MKKTSILKLITRGGIGLAALTVFGVNVAMAYIMFAPDIWPKPFYLMYQFPPTSTEIIEDSSQDDSSSPENPNTQAVSSEYPPKTPSEIRPGQGLMIDTGTKIVNLAEPSGRRYIRVNIVLEFAPDDLEYYTMPAEEQNAYIMAFDEDISTKLPVINDSLIALLSGKTFEDVYTAAGKEIVRQEIMDSLNARLFEYQVLFVYFTEFVVQ